ncbi:MAG: phytoene/squalene synthase family protein [Paracoccaceae bacterium]|nr:phytoene/squalene synthase family protein [Paracoccaceae bacterium]
MINPRDLHVCRNAIKHGSLSFYAASKLLPPGVRDSALSLYAFCRLADDAVDLHEEKIDAVLRLRDRLDAIYAGRPFDAAADRAFAAVVEMHDMPKPLPDALLEGFAWDAMEKRYDTLSGVIDYSARVASAVGAMMAVLMGVRDADALARACDLGAAMQLTNIARDVGEDARAGRIYLPLDWLREAGVEPEAFLADPIPDERVRDCVRRLLREAERLYFRSEAGIAALPLSARPGIYAARHVYAGIGGAIRKNGYDTISYRARTYKSQKIGWLALATARAGVSAAMPRSAVLHAQPLKECAFLVEAAAKSQPAAGVWGEGRTGALLAALAELESRDRRQRLERQSA